MKVIVNEILKNKGDFQKKDLQILMQRCYMRNISIHTLEVLLNHASIPMEPMAEDLSAFVNPHAAEFPPTPPVEPVQVDADKLRKQVTRLRVMLVLLGLMWIVLLFVLVCIA